MPISPRALLVFEFTRPDTVGAPWGQRQTLRIRRTRLRPMRAHKPGHGPTIVALALVLCVSSSVIALPTASRRRATDTLRDGPTYSPARAMASLGGPWSAAMDINAHGQAVGVGTNAELEARAALWSREQGAVPLGTLGGSGSLAYSINDEGHVVGESATFIGRPWAFCWKPYTGIAPLPTLGGDFGIAYDINNSGHIVGVSWDSHQTARACLWTADRKIIDLGALSGGISVARAVNNSSQVVGCSATSCGIWHAFLWTKETGIVDLGPLGDTSVWPADINDHGTVVGRSLFDGYLRAWRWSQGDLDILPDLGGGQSCANGINNLGQIVGWAEDSSGSKHAVLWDVEGIVHPISPGNQRSSIALAITDAGAVVGYVHKEDGEPEAAIWLSAKEN